MKYEEENTYLKLILNIKMESHKFYAIEEQITIF